MNSLLAQEISILQLQEKKSFSVLSIEDTIFRVVIVLL
jgi:hypothetical protein